jgi:mono/diheme cytochrome c family protein
MATTFNSRPARWLALYLGLGLGLSVAPGCQHTPIDLSEGPAPLRMPRPGQEPESYEDSLTGGQVFAMYCNQCHNARALGERPFSNYQNVAAHMRVRTNLTGKEYEKLLAFLRRWHDVPSPTPSDEPSPKRTIFPQPIAELRDGSKPATAPAQPDAKPQPVQEAPGP